MVPQRISGTAPLQLRFDLFRGRADQQRRVRFLLQRRGQRRVIAVLILAAEDDPQSARKRGDRLQRRVDIGRFRIVVPGDAVQLAHEFQPMLDARESHHRRANLRVRGAGQIARSPPRPSCFPDCARRAEELRRRPSAARRSSMILLAVEQRSRRDSLRRTEPHRLRRAATRVARGRSDRPRSAPRNRPSR